MHLIIRRLDRSPVQVVGILLVLSGALLTCTGRLLDHKSHTAMNLLGSWEKITRSDCAAQYPAVIAFKENGLYTAEADAQARFHPVWDVGTFVVEADQARLSTSNDAVIAYKIREANGQLTFTSPDGCDITYRKR